MKTYVQSLTLLLVSLALSCTAKFEDTPDKNKDSGEEITITASVEGGETKTVLSNGGASVLWTPGDAISLFYGSGTEGGSQFISTATEPSAVTNFAGTIGVITGGADIAPEDTYFWGLYPYSSTASCDGSTVTMVLPSEQVAMPGTFAPGASPSIGRSQGLSMGFYNIGGGVKFSVTKEGVRKVTLRSNDGSAIAGSAKVGFNESGIPEVREIISGTDEITLTCSTGEYFEVGEFYYMMMFPTTFNTGFTLTLETYTEEAMVVKNSSIKIGRAYFGRMTHVDASATYTTKTGNIPIPDANFKAYMVENFDKNGDGEISYEEALLVTEINVNTDNITSVNGIEYCANLGGLRCFGTLEWNSQKRISEVLGKLSSIDVSNNTSLTSLVCDFNPLTSLDVSKNTALTSLSCASNPLTSLDVSKNTSLTRLSCASNQLTSLDLSKNTALTSLDCALNQLTSLDLSKNTSLTSLDCYFNQLTSLDLSKNTSLTELYCYRNQLTNLDVSNNTSLTRLWCYSNQLTSLDVSKNTSLTELACSENQLTSLDVSKNTSLTGLSCGNNQLTSLDLSKNTSLTQLECYSNQLTSLDVSNNTSLTRLWCNSNQLTSLDVSNNTSLTRLWCDSNQLTSLDVSKNTSLTQLRCSSNQLTSLNVSNNTSLTELYCDFNQLTSLDVSKNTSLTNLDCSPMTDNYGNNHLSFLYIYEGQIIPKVTTDRDTEYIPAETTILVKPTGGGSEGYGEGDI